MIGFGVLAISSGGTAPVWIVSLLFAFQYAFGYTGAYISIRFIVGVNRAGLGYGLNGVGGNLVATVVPFVGGVQIAGNGLDIGLWCFAGLMLVGTL